jgi:hypothetical protein
MALPDLVIRQYQLSSARTMDRAHNLGHADQIGIVSDHFKGG